MGGISFSNIINICLNKCTVHIWQFLPQQIAKRVIIRKSNKLQKTIDKLYFKDTQSFHDYSKFVEKYFAPSYQYKTPVVDYKRQIERGTFFVGSNYYYAQSKDSERLKCFQNPYTKEEVEYRRNYQHFK